MESHAGIKVPLIDNRGLSDYSLDLVVDGPRIILLRGRTATVAAKVQKWANGYFQWNVLSSRINCEFATEWQKSLLPD